jgi:hypothetical protein
MNFDDLMEVENMSEDEPDFVVPKTKNEISVSFSSF